ncbi:SDR family NAD(P)-dependent oxidoreductase [Xanthomonas phaseoli pv. dieffenbachiae]|nr:SDR family NAD(P)-dependent oxidoreductase [Xanthomonas phaseoli pv. dieffenbachiae]MBO9836524.1 SDR family NAD(P)-dependent oxidoreductase [Xanthomonas phaseoli pv. dieffenbachiae]MBO9841466.1 SDR family NAD(P)-dependent oxidoreductase [Xanthomonas phaseoli pv. dieffenbachiae]MBO9861917.1 SDR family NAD(P)-dependent oxidoreductase [Xanthomonas phaseoli pv. dieffenbachiae]MBO9863947.1 SDR family NAD(P)-dependent oxidoreductase [Xanthomonas phaseoli pv. dieffenbachiae]
MPTPAIRPQRVLIAGGSRGIGLAIAEGFVRGGAHVSICARNAAGLAQAADALAAHGTPVHTLACDLADAAQIDAYVQAAAQALGGLDVVINNASGFGHGNDDASWQAGLDVDLMAAVRCNRAAPRASRPVSSCFPTHRWPLPCAVPSSARAVRSRSPGCAAWDGSAPAAAA